MARVGGVDLVRLILALIALNNVGYSQCDLLMDNFVLVADSQLRAVLQFDLTTRSLTFNITSDLTKKPTALTFDPITSTIYWTDTEVDAVFKYNLFNRSTEMFYSDNTTTSQYSGIAIDVDNRKLYVTDQQNGVIFELPLNVDDVKPRSVYVDPQSKPRSIVIDAVNRVLYWTDCRDSCEAIYRMSVNDTLTKTAILWSSYPHRQILPIALAVDFPGERIYFCDDNLKVVEEVMSDGTGRLKRDDLNKLGKTNCSALTVTTSHIYMTVSGGQTKGLYIFKRGENYKNVKDWESIGLFQQPAGIYVYNSTELDIISRSIVHRAIPTQKHHRSGGQCAENEFVTTYSSLFTIETTAVTVDGIFAMPPLVYFFGGGGALLLVVFICLITCCCCCCCRSKRRSADEGNRQVEYYDDAKTIARPIRYSQLPESNFLIKPRPPPLRTMPKGNSDGLYSEPTTPKQVGQGNANLDDANDMYYQDAIGVRPDNKDPQQLVRYTRASASDLYYQDAIGLPLNQYVPVDQDVDATSAAESGADYMYDSVRDVTRPRRPAVQERAPYLVLWDDNDMPMTAD